MAREPHWCYWPTYKLKVREVEPAKLKRINGQWCIPPEKKCPFTKDCIYQSECNREKSIKHSFSCAEARTLDKTWLRI